MERAQPDRIGGKLCIVNERRGEYEEVIPGRSISAGRPEAYCMRLSLKYANGRGGPWRPESPVAVGLCPAVLNAIVFTGNFPLLRTDRARVLFVLSVSLLE